MSNRSEVLRAGSAVIEQARIGAPAVGATTVSTGRGRPRTRGFDRPRFLPIITALVFIYLFAPILVVTWFSFNSKQSLNVFGTPSFKWYDTLIHDPLITGSLLASIEIALVTMVVSTVIGTLLAFGLVRARSRWSRPTDILMLLNLVSPEVVTGVALLLVFSEAGGFLSQFGIQFGLSPVTVVLGHITPGA